MLADRLVRGLLLFARNRVERHPRRHVSRPREARSADGTNGAVRDLEVGMMLYPTGNRAELMWEVDDELGNRGWVNSTLFGLAR